MQFFESRDGRLYPISQIARISPNLSRVEVGKPSTARVFLLSDGEFDGGIEIYAADVEVIRRAAQQVIPAQPGFMVLGYYHSNDPNDLNPWVDQSPIIAWRMSQYGPEPITLEEGYNDELGIRNAIVRPDGQVRSPAMETDFDSIEDWSEAMFKAVAEELAARPGSGD